MSKKAMERGDQLSPEQRHGHHVEDIADMEINDLGKQQQIINAPQQLRLQANPNHGQTIYLNTMPNETSITPTTTYILRNPPTMQTSHYECNILIPKTRLPNPQNPPWKTNEYDLLELSGFGIFPDNSSSALKYINRGYKPDIICLVETKNGSNFCERIREQIGMDHAYYVEPQGLSGGLALWWTNEVNMTILGANQNYMDCVIRTQNMPVPMWVTWVYVDPEPN